MRVRGLSPLNRNVLEMHGLEHQLPNYCDRNEAAMDRDVSSPDDAFHGVRGVLSVRFSGG